MQDDVALPGLRARKKRDTENAIEIAAVDLALELGHESVTVEAICERADIARSTFFNYFPTRENAITGRTIRMLRGEAADRILDEHADSLPTGMLVLTFASIGHAHINSEVARKRNQLAIEQPHTARHSTGALLLAADQLTEIAVDWLGRHPEHATLPGNPVREAVIAASLTHTLFSAVAVETANLAGDPLVAQERIQRALADVTAVLAGAHPPRDDAHRDE